MWKKFKRKVLYVHVPNEAPTNNFGWWSSQLKKGMAKGCSDWIIMYRGRVICIELKFGKGKQNDNQIAFEAWCKESETPYYVVWTMDEFIKIVDDFYGSCILIP